MGDELAIRWPPGHEPDGAVLHAVNDGRSSASPEAVWAWLIRPDLWSSYYSNARFMRHLDGPWPRVAPGSRFRWLTFGVLVTSEIVEFEPPARLAWSADELGARGHHAWALAADGEGCRIHTEETQRGWAVRLARPAMQPLMTRFHQRWVDGLAGAAAEGAPPAA
jgi:Polyketide cyclase / dehydrase and lipid transport